MTLEYQLVQTFVIRLFFFSSPSVVCYPSELLHAPSMTCMMMTYGPVERDEVSGPTAEEEGSKSRPTGHTFY
jgi:hypothetical protein